MVYGWPDTAELMARDVALATGVRLHYVERGPEAGPAVLMLHGYTDSWWSYSRVMPLMPDGLRLIALDQRGHGRSDKPAAGYDIDDFARDAVALLDALGVGRATVVGHSMGSFVARRMAAVAPARVERLVLIGTAPLAQTAAVAELVTAVDTLTDPVDVDFVREFQAGTIARRVPDDFFARVVAESAAVPAHVWRAAIRGLAAYVPAETTITCPTLVLGGEHDNVFSRDDQQAMTMQIPGATVRIAAGIGHSLHWEDPARFVYEFRRLRAR